MKERRVKIIAKSHPHYGERGVIIGSQQMTGQYVIELENCSHGVNSCMAGVMEVEEL